jgi:hypothetical protein
MCVTGPALWTKAVAGRTGCGHPVPFSPRTLAVRPVDGRPGVWTTGVGKTWLAAAQPWFCEFSRTCFTSS